MPRSVSKTLLYTSTQNKTADASVVLAVCRQHDEQWALILLLPQHIFKTIVYLSAPNSLAMLPPHRRRGIGQIQPGGFKPKPKPPESHAESSWNLALAQSRTKTHVIQ